MNNKGFAITTILYGTLILFMLLLVSLLGILSTYRGNLEKLIDNDSGAREIITIKAKNVTSLDDVTERGLYCVNGSNCTYKGNSGS